MVSIMKQTKGERIAFGCPKIYFKLKWLELGDKIWIH